MEVGGFGIGMFKFLASNLAAAFSDCATRISVLLASDLSGAVLAI